MQRFHQLLFAVSLAGLGWYAMMAVHELGHVVGAIATGGTIERVVLHPLTISRTDVSLNPRPAVVVWLGPVVGCMLPLAVFAVIPKKFGMLRQVARFFAGFCLIANGAYIAVGSFDRVGDCGEMLRTGTPLWVMLAFGTVTIPTGLYQWHALGPPMALIKDLSVITGQTAYIVFGLFILSFISGLALSPR